MPAHMFIPVQVHIPEIDSTIAALAYLSFSSSQMSWLDNRPQRNRSLLTDYIIIGDDLRIPLTVRIPREEMRNPIFLIGATFNSTLSRFAGDYLFVPDDRDSGRLVIRPPNPTDFTYNGYIAYSPISVDREERVGIRSVSLVFPNGTIVESQTIRTNVESGTRPSASINRSVMFTFIPSDLWNCLNTFLAPLGYSGITMFEVNDIDIDILPSVVFTLPSTTNQTANQDQSPFSLVLEPRHYFMPIGTDHRYHITLGSRTVDPSNIQIGRNLLQTLVVHVDGDRIGFGEPMTEL